MIFLFTEIDHPAMFKDRGTPDADHVLSSQLFLIEEILFKHGVLWMKRTPKGVLSAFEGGEPAKAAIALQKEFRDQSWKGYDKAKLRAALHVGEAEKFGQSYVGPDMNHTLKLLEIASGGQVLLTLPAVHFIPLPPGGGLPTWVSIPSRTSASPKTFTPCSTRTFPRGNPSPYVP